MYMFDSFIALSAISIHDERQKSRFRVVLRHPNGAEETFDSSRKDTQAEIDCETYAGPLTLFESAYLIDVDS